VPEEVIAIPLIPPRHDGARGPQERILLLRLALAVVQLIRAVVWLDNVPHWWPWTW
jgi:hypothetical protein